MIFKNVWNLLNIFDKTELAFEIKHLSLITSGFKSSQQYYFSVVVRSGSIRSSKIQEHYYRFFNMKDQ